MPIAPDAQWDLGDDTLGRNTRKALLEAGITPAQADTMTAEELKAVPGLGVARRARLAARLEHMRHAAAAAAALDASVTTLVLAADAAKELQAWLNGRAVDDQLGRDVRALLADREQMGAEIEQLREDADGHRRRQDWAERMLVVLLTREGGRTEITPAELTRTSYKGSFVESRDPATGNEVLAWTPAKRAPVPVDQDAQDDDQDAPWPLSALADHLRRGDPDADGRVIREVARRMAEQLPGVKKLDPGFLALDLGHALTALASVAGTLMEDWMADLDAEEMPDGSLELVANLCAAANAFANIHGSF